MFDIVSFIPRAVVQGIPLLFGSTGETLTEKSGNLNLGILDHMVVCDDIAVGGDDEAGTADCGGACHAEEVAVGDLT